MAHVLSTGFEVIEANNPNGSPKIRGYNIINGNLCLASDGNTFVSTNPAILSDELGEFPLSTKEDVHSALKAARDAFPKWASTPAPTRGQVIGNMGRLLMDHKEEIVRLQAREIGKTLKECGGEIQEAIDINENIFLYTFYNEDLIILFVDQKNTDFRIIKNIKNDILLKIKNLRLLLEEPRSNISRFNVGYDLYKILIEPFESNIQFDDKITVISDDIISSIPFASLLDNQINGDNFSEQDFLIKKYGFSYLPSIESFYLLKNLKNTDYAKKFIGVGNPNFDNTFTQLPNTESEVKFISENFENNDTVLLLGNQANETLINTTNMDSEFMMFATHALKANEVENINEPAIVLSQNLGNSNFSELHPNYHHYLYQL